ncbi:MAG: hypothetical protein ACREIB_06880 [Pseudomonadota bacterium]
MPVIPERRVGPRRHRTYFAGLRQAGPFSQMMNWLQDWHVAALRLDAEERRKAAMLLRLAADLLDGGAR